MELILLQKINKLGSIGDVVSVKPGFARNYLLPYGRALRATKENVEIFEKDKENLIAKSNEEKKNAEDMKAKVSSLKLSIVRSASDTGMLYGSVTTRDLEKLVNDEGISINRKELILDKPIKELGAYNVRVNLHPEVEVFLKLKVVRSLNEKSKELEKDETKLDGPEDSSEELNIDENLFDVISDIMDEKREDYEDWLEDQEDEDEDDD